MAHLLALCLYFPSPAESKVLREQQRPRGWRTPVAFCFCSCRSRARSRSVERARELRARQRETSRGDTILRLTSPSPSPSNPSISTRVTVRPSRAVARQPFPCARVRPCLAPSSKLWRGCDVNKVGINLLWWRGEEGGGGGGVPPVSAEALSSAFRRSLQAHTPAAAWSRPQDLL